MNAETRALLRAAWEGHMSIGRVYGFVRSQGASVTMAEIEAYYAAREDAAMSITYAMEKEGA